MRDYKREYETYHANPEQKKRRAGRNAARRKLTAEGRVKKGDGMDVDHRNHNTLDNSPANLRVLRAKVNRSLQ
jgi:hypothetical protein